MARTSSQLAHTRIASAGTDVVTGVSGTIKVCRRINLYNTGGTDVTVTIYLLRSGETTASDGAVVEKLTIPAGKSKPAYQAEGLVLRGVATDKLHLVASVDDVIDCNVFGTEE